MPIGGAAAVGLASCSVTGTLSSSITKIDGEFYNVECRPPFHTIKGKIGIKVNNKRNYHKGIKVRLQGNLKTMSTTGTNNSYTSVDTSEDVFNKNPIEVLVKSGGALTTSQMVMNFIINIPPDRVYPTPFIKSNASITYKLIALVHYDGWQIVGQKVVKFMGFHNIIGTELAPFVDQKLVDDDKITSIFTVPNTKVVMGCNESLNATLKLNGKINNRVKGTLTFFRNISYKRNKETHQIWSNVVKQTDQATDILFEWSFVVPSMSRASYSYPLYSVQYYLKYEVTLAAVDRKEDNFAIVEGLTEIQVGTARVRSFRPSAPFAALLLNRASDPAIQPSAPSSDQDIQPSAPSSDQDIQPSAPYAEQGIQMDKSVMSLFSLLSLPPAYCDLRPRSGSVLSVETQPPCYDDL